jgi:hypothetical protein
MPLTRIFCRSTFVTLLLLQACSGKASSTICDEFVTMVAPAKTSYIKGHLVFPVPEDLQALANRYLPELWVHSNSSSPISFANYLAGAKLIRHSDSTILMPSPTAATLAAMPMDQQCGTYLDRGGTRTG